MKKAKPNTKRPAAKKAAPRASTKTVYQSSWSTDGPVAVTFESDPGSDQLMWLRFARKGFDGRVFTNIADAERLHGELGARIAAAKAAFARLDPHPSAPPAAE